MISTIVLLLLLIWLGCTVAMTIVAGRAAHARQIAASRITRAPASASASSTQGEG